MPTPRRAKQSKSPKFFRIRDDFSLPMASSALIMNGITSIICISQATTQPQKKQPSFATMKLGNSLIVMVKTDQ